jgi:carnitine 3-dehydrogenase
MTRPGRLLVVHPFNPVYLLPVVEIVGGRQTDPAAIDRAMAFYPTIGM